MPELVTITPKPGTRKFQVVDNTIAQYNRVTGTDDPTKVERTGEYKGQKLPNSRQVHRVNWSFSKRRWMLHGVSGSKKSLEKLNEIVKACKLKYPAKHPSYLQYIETADIFDPEDPFFTHDKLKVIAREGEFVLDKTVAKDKILIMGIQASHEFAIKGEEGGITSNRTKYFITDKNLDAAAEENARNKEIEATQKFTALSLDEKVKIAMAMGLLTRETDVEPEVDKVLWEAAHDKTRRIAGLTRQDYFLAMCEASSDEINVRYLMQKARGDGHLKKTVDGWVLFGQNIGLDDKHVYSYFKNRENQDMINRLQDVLRKDPVPAPSRVERDSALIDLGDTEAAAPKAEVPPKEDFDFTKQATYKVPENKNEPPVESPKEDQKKEDE